ncbi:MAG: hypothetical protein R3D29_05905 [Nitratireductor sp.]
MLATAIQAPVIMMSQNRQLTRTGLRQRMTARGQPESRVGNHAVA